MSLREMALGLYVHAALDVGAARVRLRHTFHLSAKNPVRLAATRSYIDALACQRRADQALESADLLSLVK